MQIIYENKQVQVSINSSGEIFVTNLETGAVIRVSDSYGALVITAAGCIMTPTAFNGLSAFRVEYNG